MNNEKMPYNPTPGDYDVEKLSGTRPEASQIEKRRDDIAPTDNLNPLSTGENSKSSKGSMKNSNSSNKSRNNKNVSDTTERIPTLAKYSDMNRDDGEFEYKGEI